MIYSRRVFQYLKDSSINMFEQNIYRFMLIWIALSFLPIISNVIFEFITHIFSNLYTKYLELALIFALPIFVGAFAAFLFISLWVAFESKVALQTKLMLILLAYVLIWLSFGNLYYFLGCMDSFGQVKQLQNLGLSITETIAQAKNISSNTLSTLPSFWELKIIGNDILPVSSNRLANYIDCLYFSGVNILTIGFGDIVPIGRFVKMIVLLECFLVNIINILAVGMWLSTVNKK